MANNKPARCMARAPRQPSSCGCALLAVHPAVL